MSTTTTESSAFSPLEWTEKLHKDMIAATILDPTLISFRAIATDQPESVIRSQLLAELSKPFYPSGISISAEQMSAAIRASGKRTKFVSGGQ